MKANFKFAVHKTAKTDLSTKEVLTSNEVADVAGIEPAGVTTYFYHFVINHHNNPYRPLPCMRFNVHFAHPSKGGKIYYRVCCCLCQEIINNITYRIPHHCGTFPLLGNCISMLRYTEKNL